MTTTMAMANEPRRSEQVEEVEAFERDGYLVVRQLFTPDEINEMREAFMEQAKDGPVPGLSDQHFAVNSDDPLARYPRMMHPHKHSELGVGPLSMRRMLDARIERTLTALYGEEPVAAQSMFYFKPAGSRGQDLHQDNFYLRVAPGTCIAAWVAVDDADEENGTLVVVPGSNNLPVACPEKADTSRSFTSDHVAVPAGMRTEAVLLRAGDVLFFNGSLIHGSYPNVSADRFRRAFICHYVPRSSSEMSGGYRPLYTFAGDVVEMADAQGGGPCGTNAPIALH